MWTDEQELIFASEAPINVIEAYAGTGKSSTLREYAVRKANLRYLYLVFNKSAQVEAAGKFGDHVRVMTIHSLAYRHVGHRFKHKLGFKMSAVGVARTLAIDNVQAKAAIAMLERFCCSAGSDLAETIRPRGTEIYAVRAAQKLWERMIDPDDLKVPMIHDGYLKLFQLEGHQVTNIDVLMVDEMQDSNDVTVAIIRQQRAARLLVVGDAHQSIYGFRGSSNALKAFDGERFFLTASFRFGPAVGRVADAILAQKGERRPVIGLGGPTEVFVEGRAEGRHAFLSRTNAGALMYAAAREGEKVFFTGGFDAYRPNRIRDAYSLWKGRRNEVTDPEFRHFRTFAELERYAHSTSDVEIQSVLFFIETNGDGTPGIIDDLEGRSETRTGAAAFAVSTFHKAKGAEYQSVVLGEGIEWEDFVLQRAKGFTPSLVEEVNLLYVAATRARFKLRINNAIHMMFKEYTDAAEALSAAA